MTARRPVSGKPKGREEKHVVSLNREIREDYDYNEAIKTLRTNIQFCGSSIRTVMFTSAMPDEGKSDTSFALAQSLAQISRRTLMIDTDIRKSVLVSRYHLEREVNGLSQYLSGQSSLEDVIYETNLENLSVVFAGPYSPNPAELLEEPLFAQLLAYAREHYDYVILDTAPLGGLIDAAIVARHCDGAVMVIESEAISRRLEQRVKEQLEKSGCRILGVVLNKVDLHHNRYYGKYGKYGHYGKYGKYGKYGGYGHYGRYGGNTDIDPEEKTEKKEAAK
ncbi:MAG: CpsD/CapB family tyrosine-protein kinase [Clostridiales bacterium]|nr:CpsD/CapB family tyrosine-protein kinase [Clostridiales bacterium]